MSSTGNNASSSSNSTGEGGATNNDNQDNIPGFSSDEGTTSSDNGRPVTPTTAAGRPIEDWEREELIKESQNIRNMRWWFFLVFSGIALISFFLLPIEVYLYVNNGLITLISDDSATRRYAIISMNVIFAVAGAVPLTIFITLSKLFRKNIEDEKSSDKKEDKDKNENISDAIKTIISTLSTIVKNVKDAWKGGIK
ncbi:hypothetical protein [Komagataeibacter oboediens]|uniref:hypothetical protein n=1 Tax=Komagataeibacter oboediens TaxID=65958 RepID=UPI0019060FBE|nr:hypothetical protein [Komagataeibacter oboediens]GCE80656.1 hypothetical protein MSKU3_2131 [Komagataeibacter oboediens]